MTKMQTLMSPIVRLRLDKNGSSLVAQQTKDPALSLLWYRFNPWPQELPHVLGMAKKKKKKKIEKAVKKTVFIFIFGVPDLSFHFPFSIILGTQAF